jgi:hypothetical protein
MCFREITCCDPAILSIMFVHGEDMQLFDIHGKEGVDMIVQMDAIECKKAGSDSLLAARTTPSADSDEVARAFRDDVARCSDMMSPGVRCLAG